MANGSLLEEKAKIILGRGLTVNEVINAGSGCARAAASAIDCACAYQSEMSPPRIEFVSPSTLHWLPNTTYQLM